MTKKHTLIERIAEKIGVIPDLHAERDPVLDRMTVTDLNKFPPMEEWDHWEEYEATSWPRKRRRLTPLCRPPVSIVKVHVD